MLSLIMPVYVVPGNETVVHDCLDSIGGQWKEFDNRIVIVNGPTPSELLLQRLKEISGDDFLFYDHALGAGKAMNLGLSRSFGDVITISNDVIVGKNWVDGLRKYASEVRGVTFCADRRSNKGTIITENRPRGACFYLPEYVIRKVGRWDNGLTWRYHDQDYWIRCKLAGFRLSLLGMVPINHSVSYAHEHLKMMMSGFDRAVKREKDKVIYRYGTFSYVSWVRRREGIFVIPYKGYHQV